MTGQRYVVITTRFRNEKKDNVTGVFTDVLSPYMVLDTAIVQLDFEWDHLTLSEKRKSMFVLAFLAMDGEYPFIDDTFLNSQGFDTLVDYTPLATRRLKDD